MVEILVKFCKIYIEIDRCISMLYDALKLLHNRLKKIVVHVIIQRIIL